MGRADVEPEHTCCERFVAMATGSLIRCAQRPGAIPEREQPPAMRHRSKGTCVCSVSEPVVTVYQPVGQKELDRVAETGFRAFPPRLPSQPILYPPSTRSTRARSPATGAPQTRHAATSAASTFAPTSPPDTSHYRAAATKTDAEVSRPSTPTSQGLRSQSSSDRMGRTPGSAVLTASPSSAHYQQGTDV